MQPKYSKSKDLGKDSKGVVGHWTKVREHLMQNKAGNHEMGYQYRQYWQKLQLSAEALEVSGSDVVQSTKSPSTKRFEVSKQDAERMIRHRPPKFKSIEKDAPMAYYHLINLLMTFS